MAAAVNVRCSPVVGPLAQLRSSAGGITGHRPGCRGR
jgi:hypothetical protein